MSLGKVNRACKRFLLSGFLGLVLSQQAVANQVLIYPVISPSDDAEENIGDVGGNDLGVIDLNSSDIEIGTERGTVETAQRAGLRFSGIDIPRGTPVVSAHIQFTSDETRNNNPFNITIWAESSNDSATFNEAQYNITDRPLSQASVNWTAVNDWQVVHESGSAQQTPDLRDLVQEVVNRDGWNAGNAMTFLLEGSGRRVAESSEGSASHLDGLNGFAPKLVIVLPNSIEVRINSSDSDAEEDIASGEMDIQSSDLELAWENSSDSSAQVIGLRFAKASIPQGAEILSAHIQFGQDEDKNNNPFELSIRGEASDNAEVYQDINFNVSSRSTTEASIDWSGIDDWTVRNEVSPSQRTPDLRELVQEIVNRDGWQEGNAMGFVLQGQGTRTAEAFDGNSSLAPVLQVTFIGEIQSPSADKVRLAWNDDPATTMTVIWNQLRGSSASVYYDLYDGSNCSTDPADYANQQAPYRETDEYDMRTNVSRLVGLDADTSYRYVIADASAVSDCMWFRTAPNTPKPFTYVSGGDTKSSGNALQVGRWSNEMVAKLRPLFVFFTGDFLSGDGTNAGAWKQWLDDWSIGSRSQDGRMYPIVSVHGNHEDGDFEILYKLFDSGNPDPQQPNNYAYNALDFGGNLLRAYNLNSQLYLNGMSGAHDLQTDWLSNQLINNQGYTFNIAGYHKPMRPHTRSKSENDFLVNDWAPLFDDYNIDIAYESDTHNHVYTFPIRLAGDGETGDMGFVRDDVNGTLHVGEGSWGATPRDNNDDKSWTLDSASFNQIKWNHVYPATDSAEARIEIRSLKTAEYIDGVLTNFVDAVEALSEDDVFRVPEGASVHNVPFYGSYITAPFQAVSGEAPTAPQILSGVATSNFDIELTWFNTADPELVRFIQVERRIGLDGEWMQAGSNVDSDATMFTQGNLSDGVDYYYRVRAVNIFGSEASNEVLVSTPKDTRLKASFQQGLNGYTQNSVIAIASASPNNSFAGEELSIDQATSDYGGPGSSQGLISFADLFGANGVPANVIVDSAELRIRTSSSTNGPVSLHQMLQPWDGGSSWNSFAEGIQANDLEAREQQDDSLVNLSSSSFDYFDVTDAVKAWANGEPNYGWVVINSSTDGWDFYTDSYSAGQEQRPLLTVFYKLLGDIDENAVLDRSDLIAIRAYLRQDASACVACDVDKNGIINSADLRNLALLIRAAQ